MKIVLQNITYQHCPVELREQLTLSDQQQHRFLHKMRNDGRMSEAAIIQTCNRLEFYTYAKKSLDCQKYLAELISDFFPTSAVVWNDYHDCRQGLNAVTHLFSVAAGLDSQMIGENQILSQVKNAYKTSLDCRMSRLIFHRLFHIAFRAGKTVRTHTNINTGAVSISQASVELAAAKLKLQKAKAVVIGAGDNAELACKLLLKRNVEELIIANRNIDNALNLANRLKTGRVIALEQLPENLLDIDLLISTTSSPGIVLSLEAASSYLNQREKPLLMIDIAVPRDIDPALADHDLAQIVNIDQLNEHIDINKQLRNGEIPRAKQIVAEFTTMFQKWYDSLEIVPLISQLNQYALDLARSEAQRYAPDFADKDKQKLELFAQSLVKKILHNPISYLKSNNDEDPTTEQLQAADIINRMFFAEQYDIDPLQKMFSKPLNLKAIENDGSGGPKTEHTRSHANDTESTSQDQK